MFIRFMCFLPGYFSAGRFADLALPKVSMERDDGPIRCQGEHRRHNVTGSVGGRPLDAGRAVFGWPRTRHHCFGDRNAALHRRQVRASNTPVHSVQVLSPWIVYMLAWIGSFEKSGALLPPHSRKVMRDTTSV
jgi:hypothetical protein